MKASVSPNKSAGFVLVVFLTLLAAGNSFAARGDPLPATKRPLPLGCWIASDGFVHDINFTTKQEEISKPVCQQTNGAGITVVKPICIPATPPLSSSYQFVNSITTVDCAKGQVCDQGVCIAKPKPIGCYDSDFVGKSDTSTWGTWLDKYNDQIKTPGFVRDEAGAVPTFVADECKGGTFIYEQVCKAASPSDSLQQRREKVPVSCPSGYICKILPIDKGSIFNADAMGAGAPTQAAQCIPAPDPCPEPFDDMCPDIAGCQYTSKDCPANPELCSSEDLIAKYAGQDVTVMGSSGKWHIDSCSTGTKVKHDYCESGAPYSGITLCPEGQTCKSGLCNGKPAPEIKPDPTKPVDCEDTDIAGSNNGYGKLDVIGQIEIKGKIDKNADDICAANTNKIVKQFKCDALSPAGYSGKLFTCSSGTKCCIGACLKEVPCSCKQTTNTAGKVTISGSDTCGLPFNNSDVCKDLITITRFKCDPNSCITTTDEPCPPGSTCNNGLCAKPTINSCTELADGVKTTEDGVPKDYKNSCGGSFLTKYTCKDNKALSTIESCPTGMCENAACVTCKDTDPDNKIDIKGSVTATTNGSGLDFCIAGDNPDLPKKLVQQDCAKGLRVELPPALCPTGQKCSDGSCVSSSQCSKDADCADADLCTQEACIAGKCGLNSATPVLPSSACEKFSCDPKTGKIVSTPQNLCPAGQACDATKQCKTQDLCAGKNVDDGDLCTIDNCILGIAKHTPKCAAPDTCNAATGACVPPKPETGKSLGQSCAQSSECDDQNTCNGMEICTANKCSAGKAPIEGASPKSDALCFDDDSDGISNTKDNCPKMYNPDQADVNKNGKGDVCEVFLTSQYYHTCASYLDGSLKCWGKNDSSQIGIGTKSPYEWKPSQVLSEPQSTPLINVTGLASGTLHNCALSGTADVSCWGGVQDPYSTKKLATPDKDASANGDIQKLTAGYLFNCTLHKTGQVRCWGINDNGQTGAGANITTVSKPLVVLEGARDVSAGTQFTCAVTVDGHVKCWGSNGNGQLGNGKTSGDYKYGSIFYAREFSPVDVQTTPYDSTGKTPLKLLSNVNQVIAGGSFACAILKDSSVMCWGFLSGSLSYATAVLDASGKPITNVIALSAGAKHACVAFKDGSVSCWGTNHDGQVIGASQPWLPDENYLTPIPVTLPGIEGVTQLAAGEKHTCARVKDMSVKCWGDNTYGQLVKAPHGLPSCMVKDPYAASGGCADNFGKKMDDAILVCNPSGNASCEKGWAYTNPDYKTSCPSPAKDTDIPQCIKVDYGVPNCLVDSYGKLIPKCSLDIGKVMCDPYGKILCGSPLSASVYTYNPYGVTCSLANTPPICSKPGTPNMPNAYATITITSFTADGQKVMPGDTVSPTAILALNWTSTGVTQFDVYLINNTTESKVSDSPPISGNTYSFNIPMGTVGNNIVLKVKDADTSKPPTVSPASNPFTVLEIPPADKNYGSPSCTASMPFCNGGNTKAAIYCDSSGVPKCGATSMQDSSYMLPECKFFQVVCYKIPF